mmetsp:Transcript_12757/g.24846  ORF Transcript_12757/g.24846 Transcript_12757/m.24846 type:complete len:119 (+) Transcript_12757:1385-1741(+)
MTFRQTHTERREAEKRRDTKRRERKHGIQRGPGTCMLSILRSEVPFSGARKKSHSLPLYHALSFFLYFFLACMCVLDSFAALTICPSRSCCLVLLYKESKDRGLLLLSLSRTSVDENE